MIQRRVKNRGAAEEVVSLPEQDSVCVCDAAIAAEIAASQTTMRGGRYILRGAHNVFQN